MVSDSGIRRWRWALALGPLLINRENHRNTVESLRSISFLRGRRFCGIKPLTIFTSKTSEIVCLLRCGSVVLATQTNTAFDYRERILDFIHKKFSDVR